MQHYDLLVLVPATHTDQEVEEICGTVRTLLSQKKVQPTYEEQLGKRRLAYRIKGVRHGVYASFGFYAEHAILSELHQSLRLISEILRYQLVQMDEKSEEQKAREAEAKARQSAREAERGAVSGKTPRLTQRPSTPLGAPKIREKTRAPELEPDVQPQTVGAVAMAEGTPSPTPSPSAVPPEAAPKAAPSTESEPSTGFTPSSKAKKAEEKIKLEELDERLDKILDEDIL
jgi:small subunit ribosomal protein S6